MSPADFTARNGRLLYVSGYPPRNDYNVQREVEAREDDEIPLLSKINEFSRMKSVAINY
jgi:hypothetical protein